MEHSKLPWYVEDVDNMRSNRRPESLEINNDEWNIAGWTEAEVCGGVYEQDIANAAFIVTACNEHDALKECHESKQKLVREIDSIISAGQPAKQASLCDLVKPIQSLKRKAELLDDFVDYCNEKTPGTSIEVCSLEMCVKINELTEKAKELS